MFFFTSARDPMSDFFCQKIISWSMHNPPFLILLVVSTPLKNISQNWIISPGRDENKTYLKPPPSYESLAFFLTVDGRNPAPPEIGLR